MGKKSWVGIPPWIILGAVSILVPIFVFWTVQNISKQKEQMVLLLLEKGAALIRSFEAGTRTGMMGMMGMRGGGFQLQKLLTETAQQPDIVHLIVTDIHGTILAHNDPSRIGCPYGRDLDLGDIYRSQTLSWRQVVDRPGDPATFEVFRRFSPTFIPPRIKRGSILQRRPHDLPPAETHLEETGQVIFVGMDMAALEEARREDTWHTVLMAVILLLIGFGGMVTLFLAQAYRSTKTSLTRIMAFSDNVVENMPIGLVAIGADRRIASFNQAAESVLHISAGHALEQKADEVLPQSLLSLLSQVKGSEKVLEVETDCLVADGLTVPLDVSVSLLVSDEGMFWGHIILFRDLTEVQHLKKEVERSRRLASLGRLAAGIAHEIRNPLSSIKGFATYFRDRYRENPEDQATATVMIQEVDRLNRVINQLLELARPVNIQKRMTPIHKVIQYSLKMIEKQAASRGIRIRADLSPQLREIPLDPDRFNQVLLNLYLNAIEAMEEGGTLSIGLGLEDDGKRGRLSVSDTGIGIAKEDLAHIFDPYFTTRQSGTGLGLAIVHKIIESHGGEVRVESEVEHGTKVTILLPMDLHDDGAKLFYDQ